MEVTVVNTGELDPLYVYDVQAGVANNPDLYNYIQQNLQEFQQVASNVGYMLADAVKQTVDYFTNNRLIQKAVNLLKTSSPVIKDDMIQLLDINQIPDAGLMMRQYLMAEPYWFNMYQKQRCEGWSGVWEETEMDLPATWRDDYLNAMDGILQVHDTYSEVIQSSLENDNPINVSDRLILSIVRDRMEELMNKGIDPTDPTRNKL